MDREAAEDGGGAEADAPATGLQNNIGEYNCFLNVILQCLYRCQAFQAAFMDVDPSGLQVPPPLQLPPLPFRGMHLKLDVE